MGNNALDGRDTRRLLCIGLRVMSHVINRQQPLLRDIELLRQHALSEEVSLDVDDLACAIIRREIDDNSSHPRRWRNLIRQLGNR
jgi:hypothetical protein